MIFFMGAVKKALLALGLRLAKCRAGEILINLRHKLPTPSTVNRDYAVAVGGVKQLRRIGSPCALVSPEYGTERLG